MVKSVGCIPSHTRLKVLRPVSLSVPPRAHPLCEMGMVPASPLWEGFSGIPGSGPSPWQAWQAVHSLFHNLPTESASYGA